MDVDVSTSVAVINRNGFVVFNSDPGFIIYGGDC